MLNPQQDSFFFYDFESFGINPAIDRPAQFAGIRTDREFNIISEPVMFYCKQTNDYLPDPNAILVTGITPQFCNQNGLIEPEFANRIHDEFSQNNTCILGYNNIRYDDEMTRYLFYRNFLDPYEYAWKNGNSRWDLLDVVRACYALRPEGINWPLDDNGLPSFRLSELTKANHIEHHNAHDAMADVYATIAIAKLIKQSQPKLFAYFFTNRLKKAVEQQIDVANMAPLVHVSGMFGNQRGNVALIVPIAWHPDNKNAVIACDLNANIDGLLTENVQQLKQDLYTKKTDLIAQNKLPVPLKLIHINKSPILAPPKTLSIPSAKEFGIDHQFCFKNLQRLSDSVQIKQKVIDIYQRSESFSTQNEDIEARLYDGFYSFADKNNLAILRTLSAENLSQHDLKFEDPRIETLLFHYRARHFYPTLTRHEQIKWQKYRHSKLQKNIDKFTTVLESLANEYAADNRKLELLKSTYDYAQKIII